MASSPVDSQATEPLPEGAGTELRGLVAEHETHPATLLGPDIRAYAKSSGYPLAIQTFPDAMPAMRLDGDLHAITQSSRSAGFDLKWTTADGLFHLRFYYHPQHFEISQLHDSATRL